MGRNKAGVVIDGDADGVALLAEGVGRNSGCWKYGRFCYVALLAEGVGRNCDFGLENAVSLVALLAEGVGRNFDRQLTVGAARVALLAEGVGRNARDGLPGIPSDRRPPRGGRG